jgi:hypothetical protein
MFFDNHKSAPVGIKLEFNWAFHKYFLTAGKEKNRKSGKAKLAGKLFSTASTDSLIPPTVAMLFFSPPLPLQHDEFFFIMSLIKKRDFTRRKKIIFVRHEARRRR